MTTKKQVEEALRWYEIILASVSDPISFVDREYRYRFVNEAYIEFAKRPLEEILGLSIAELLGTEAFEKTIKPHFDRWLAGNEVHYEAWFEVPGAQPRFMHVEYYPIFDEAQAVVGGVVVSRDRTEHRLAEEALARERDLIIRIMDTSPIGILRFDREGLYPLLDRSGEIDGLIVATENVTARVQAEARLQESEKRYRQLLEALQEGIWVIDRDAHTPFVNPRMAEILGYTVEEIALAENCPAHRSLPVQLQ